MFKRYRYLHFPRDNDLTAPGNTVHRDHAERIRSIGMNIGSLGFFRGREPVKVTELDLLTLWVKPGEKWPSETTSWALRMWSHTLS